MNDALREWVRRVLKLPEGNPMLPAADPSELRVVNPSPDYLRYSLVFYWVGLAALAPILLIGEAAGVAGLFAVAPRAGAPSGLVLALGLVTAVGLLVFAAVACWFRYFTITLEVDMLRYTFSDRAMRLRRGVMQIEEATISYANIQNIRLLQGPIQRAFRLADLVVDTAGGGGRMPANNPEMEGLSGHRGLIKGVGEPEKLRDWLLEKMRHCRGAGLGDAHDAVASAPLRAGDAHPFPAAAALEPLRAIRDELRQANASLRARSS